MWRCDVYQTLVLHLSQNKFSVSECLLPHFLKLGVTHFEIVVWRLTGAFCFLFHAEATPLAHVDAPFATFCTSWFLGMWPLFPLQWAAEGTRKETDRVGRSAWEVECVCAVHTATKIKLKDVNPICGRSTGTLVPDLLQRCYFDIGNVRCWGNREMIFKNRCVCLICRVRNGQRKAGDLTQETFVNSYRSF